MAEIRVLLQMGLGCSGISCPIGDAGGDGWCSQHSSCRVLLPGDALQLLCTGVLHGFGCTAFSAHAVCPVVPQCKSSWGLLLNSPRVGWAVQVGFPELMGSACFGISAGRGSQAPLLAQSIHPVPLTPLRIPV